MARSSEFLSAHLPTEIELYEWAQRKGLTFINVKLHDTGDYLSAVWESPSKKDVEPPTVIGAEWLVENTVFEVNPKKVVAMRAASAKWRIENQEPITTARIPKIQQVQRRRAA